jgi:hypothetical protein
MTIIRLLVTGSRTYTDRARLERVLDAIHRKHPIEVLIHGACHLGGADTLADEWAKDRGVPVKACPVIAGDGPWPEAGPRRNHRMLVNERPTHCVAFPTANSKGTWDMVRQFNARSEIRAPAWVIDAASWMPAASVEDVG